MGNVNPLVWERGMHNGSPAITLHVDEQRKYTFVRVNDYYVTVYRTLHVPYEFTECFGNVVIENKLKPSIIDLVYIQMMIYQTDKRNGRINPNSVWNGLV